MHTGGRLHRRRPLAQVALLMFMGAPTLALGCRSQEAGGPAEPWLSTPADVWTPETSGWVTDLGELLSPEEEWQLAGILLTYRDETGHEFAVLTVPGLDGEAIERFSLRVARSWGVGRAGIDDGLLVVVAASERSMRIEVGDGITDLVSDALAAEVIERDFVPAFRRGDWVGGLDTGLRALMEAARGCALR